MGMFDEIIKKCPNCKDGRLYTQTKVLDCHLNVYDLDNPEEWVEEYPVADIYALRDDLRSNKMICQRKGGHYNNWSESHGCGYSEYAAEPYVTEGVDKVALIKKLLSKED